MTADGVMDNIRNLFERSGMTLNELGEGLGYDGPTAKKRAWFLLYRTSDPRISTVLAATQTLGVKISEGALRGLSLIASILVCVGAGLVGMVASPEVGHRIAIAEIVGPQLEDSLAGFSFPELFGSLDPSIDLLDCRLDMSAGDGQALLPVRRIVHVDGIVLEIGQRPADMMPNVALAIFRRLTVHRLQGLQVFDDFRHVALPNQLCPLLVRRFTVIDF